MYVYIYIYVHYSNGNRYYYTELTVATAWRGGWREAPGLCEVARGSVISIYLSIYIYIYIYIYILSIRERDRERERYIHVYIYIYIFFATASLEGAKGVPRNGVRKGQLVSNRLYLYFY